MPFVPHSSDLRDTDPMPIGKFKGTPMQGVPAAFLLWMADNMGRDVTGDRWRVRRYIDRNRAALEQEVEDKKQGRATRSEQRGTMRLPRTQQEQADGRELPRHDGEGDPDAGD